jgi:uncharacterized protein (DUF433 family)
MHKMETALMRQLVSRPSQVVANIRRFADELRVSPGLQATLSYVHAWYALRLENDRWIFAPSKFVAYCDNTAKQYLGTFRQVPDGGRPEQTLRGMFTEVDQDSSQGRMLIDELIDYVGEYGRAPRRRVRISIVSDDAGDSPAPVLSDRALLSRISMIPEVCGGRPCIKGTRMRVSDIVDMLAAGATRGEILEDFPYLTEEDVSAALAYAARATDHRVVRAA